MPVKVTVWCSYETQGAEAERVDRECDHRGRQELDLEATVRIPNVFLEQQQHREGTRLQTFYLISKMKTSVFKHPMHLKNLNI